MVLDAPVQLQVVGQSDHLAVHPRPHEAALEHVGEQVLVFPLLPPDHRRQHEEPRTLRQRQDAGENLFPRLRRDRPAALGAMSLTDPRVENAEVVVNLRNGADGGAGVAAGRLLLNAYGGG